MVIITFMTRLTGTLLAISLGTIGVAGPAAAFWATNGSGERIEFGCTTVSKQSTTQTRAYLDTTREGDATGVQTRKVTTIVLDCHGHEVTKVKRSRWSSPHGFMY